MDINNQDFSQEIDWLTELINARFQLYFGLESQVSDIREIQPPELLDSDYALFLHEKKISWEERIAIGLCLMLRLRPQSLDIFFTKNKTFERPFVEFGGMTIGSRSAFYPTGESLLFLLAGSDIEARLKHFQLLNPSHRLYQDHILELQATEVRQLAEKRLLRLTPEMEARFIWKESFQPEYGSEFPASLLRSPMEWDDLVLAPRTAANMQEIIDWISHGDKLMQDWGMHKKLRPGMRILFYGPPGTGKTLTAALLGKETKREVYRIDLSAIVSKYIGETEKNLAKVFDLAEFRNWILFFDEADALFGKRTQVSDAHDRYANQEVSYLLQRIENFDGVVILASNLRNNLDEAFSRRFESLIQFPMPSARERKSLWEKGFSTQAAKALDPNIDWNAIAESYELTGGSIMNIIRYVALKAVAGDQMISEKDILAGIRREFAKEGKTI